MKKVIRITRHPLDADRKAALLAAFGEVEIISVDVPYGNSPIETVSGLISSHGGNVVAVEVIAPLPVLSQLLQARRELGEIKIIRAVFARDQSGRAVVTGQDESGRDILAFDHYEVVKKVEVVTEPL